MKLWKKFVDCAWYGKFPKQDFCDKKRDGGTRHEWYKQSSKTQRFINGRTGYAIYPVKIHQ